ISFDGVGNGLWIGGNFGGTSALLARYNYSGNVTNDFRTGACSRIGQSINGIGSDTLSNGAYIVTAYGQYYYYNQSANCIDNLTATDTNDWISSTTLTDIKSSPKNRTAYLTGVVGVFGAYLSARLGNFLPVANNVSITPLPLAINTQAKGHTYYSDAN